MNEHIVKFLHGLQKNKFTYPTNEAYKTFQGLENAPDLTTEEQTHLTDYCKMIFLEKKLNQKSAEVEKMILNRDFNFKNHEGIAVNPQKRITFVWSDETETALNETET